MVKNTKGGNHKGQARKHANGSQRANNKLRIAEDECEIYAQVTKMLGNGMCHVDCMDLKNRLCIIRGKFRGRGKRDNTLVNGTWCLIGLRDYLSEAPDGKMDKCDLLEVYAEGDKSRLRSQVTDINWNKFLTADASNSFTTIDETLDIEFADEREQDYRRLMEQQIKEGGTAIATKLDLSVDDEGTGDIVINIDDI
jgi:initiation factor 1A